MLAISAWLLLVKFQKNTMPVELIDFDQRAAYFLPCLSDRSHTRLISVSCQSHQVYAYLVLPIQGLSIVLRFITCISLGKPHQAIREVIDLEKFL